VMKADTAYSVRTSRQSCGSKGTLSEPNVKTAANNSDSPIPPSVSGRRCLQPGRLMAVSPVGGGGHFSSEVVSRVDSQALPCGATRFWQDSHALPTSQEIHLYYARRACSNVQVLAISKRLAKFSRCPSAHLLR